MTDLAYCYNHMTDALINDVEVLAEVEEELLNSDLEIPVHEIPPNPDDYEALPSQIHPSYPYGNPTNMNHPAAQPRTHREPASRALYVDSMCTGIATATLRWNDLALDLLLPTDNMKAEASSAAIARKNVAGNIQLQNPREEDSEESNEQGQGDDQN